jgi:cytochrome c biogenesis protein ResB
MEIRLRLLGLGDRAVLHVADRDIEIGYFPKRVVLPFSVRLDRFTIEHDQGTLTPASYASRVTVLGGKGQQDVTISMNEPLQLNGYTLYQASYEEGTPRPVTSILAVNRDPGRIWKYLGSLLIVMGSVLLFAQKYKRARAK